MSRHGFSDYDDWYDNDANLAMGRWQGRVKSAPRGKRGQAFLRNLIAALDAMPVKELYAHNLAGDCVCAMGALAKAKASPLRISKKNWTIRAAIMSGPLR